MDSTSTADLDTGNCKGANVSDEAIIRANAQFWEQMVAMQLEPLPGTSEFCAEPGDVRSTVELSGAWNGEVEVRMARGLGVEVTAAMLLQSAEAVTEADMLDAAREIANMIAGVLKSSLPKPSAMSLPRAEIAPGTKRDGLQRAEETAVAFHHAAGRMMVRVSKGDENELTDLFIAES